MGFSFRKSVSVGPFRFNLSGSGIGASVGAGGLRVGTGPRGSYVSVSSHGLTYRTALGRPGPRRAPGAPRAPELPALPVDGEMHEVTSGDVLEMADSNSDELLQQLNGGLKAWDPTPMLLALLGVLMLLCAPGVLLGAFGVPAAGVPVELVVLPIVGSALCALVGVGLLSAAASARRRFRLENTAVLMFDIDQEAEKKLEALYDGLDELKGCGALWHVGSQGATHDWKRNAGATTLVNRAPARPLAGDPVGACTNVAVQHLPAGRERLYFMPDRLLVYDKARNRYGAVSYADLEVEVGTTRFIVLNDDYTSPAATTTPPHLNRP